MNLIEQLGGYDNAKKLRGTTSNALLDMKTWTVHVDDIDLALLEHRRANNIFEVGDCVVKTNPKIKHAHVRVVISTSPSGGVVLDYQGFPYKFPRVRHATNEEIEAGRRLSKIKCWSCDKEMSHSERAKNDGFCIHCNAEIEL